MHISKGTVYSTLIHKFRAALTVKYKVKKKQQGLCIYTNVQNRKSATGTQLRANVFTKPGGFSTKCLAKEGGGDQNVSMLKHQ